MRLTCEPIQFSRAEAAAPQPGRPHARIVASTHSTRHAYACVYHVPCNTCTAPHLGAHLDVHGVAPQELVAHGRVATGLLRPLELRHLHSGGRAIGSRRNSRCQAASFRGVPAVQQLPCVPARLCLTLRVQRRPPTHIHGWGAGGVPVVHARALRRGGNQGAASAGRGPCPPPHLALDALEHRLHPLHAQLRHRVGAFLQAWGQGGPCAGAA